MTTTTPSNGIHHVEHVMGMAVSIDVRDAGATVAAVVELVEWLHHVDHTFSTYRAESPISALGRGEVLLADTTDEIRSVLRLCEQMRVLTGGAFDAFEVPAPNGTRFDPSGLVKGWAIERGAEILERNGCVDFCVNAGGDVAVRGHPAPGAPWRVGVRHPADERSLATVVECTDHLAIATSATYERGEHIVDPRSGGHPRGLSSATVVGPDLTIADAFATAMFVMGLGGIEWIEDQKGYDAYVVTDDGTPHWTPGFARYSADR